MPMDFVKLPADKNVTVAIGPAGGATGIQNVNLPTAAELNNTGNVSLMVPASQSISWNDWDFGFSASETTSEPSLADDSSYEDFTTYVFGGGMSFYLPEVYDDASNLHSVIFDLTSAPGALIDVAVRVDGAKKVTTPFANGDFVHTYEVQGASETNPFTPGESTRRTVNFNSYGNSAGYTIVGPHTITRIGTGTFSVAAPKGRLRFAVQDRDYTNALTYRSSNAAVIEVYPGGFYQIKGTTGGTATITVEDKRAGTNTTVSVTLVA